MWGEFVMVDIEKALKSIAAETDTKKLKNWMVNGEKHGKREIVAAVANRVAELEGFDYSDPIEREVYQALKVAEACATLKNGKTTRLSRTRQKLAKETPLEFTKWVLRPSMKTTQGFDILHEYNLLEHTCEAIALRHPHNFTDDELATAKERLERAQLGSSIKE